MGSAAGHECEVCCCLCKELQAVKYTRLSCAGIQHTQGLGVEGFCLLLVIVVTRLGYGLYLVSQHQLCISGCGGEVPA